jgi:hypothetical protein
VTEAGLRSNLVGGQQDVAGISGCASTVELRSRLSSAGSGKHLTFAKDDKAAEQWMSDDVPIVLPVWNRGAANPLWHTSALMPSGQH